MQSLEIIAVHNYITLFNFHPFERMLGESFVIQFDIWENWCAEWSSKLLSNVTNLESEPKAMLF